jgi:hypothetical protein
LFLTYGEIGGKTKNMIKQQKLSMPPLRNMTTEHLKKLLGKLY